MITARRRTPPHFFDGLYGRAMLRALATMTVDGGPDGECWDWVGSFTGGRNGRRGYPAARLNGRPARPYRMAFEAAFGPLPPGEQVHHRCGRRSCVRPEHLQAATDRDNVAEMQARQALLRRIAALESALREWRPDHPALEGDHPVTPQSNY